jgi:GNAT superfamily N-acetyltransferase
MKLKVFDQNTQLNSPALKKWSCCLSMALISKHYLAYEAVAFVTLDEPANMDYLCIYKLFVGPEFRRKGIGTKVIHSVEELAKTRNCPKVCLRPRSLENYLSDEQLISWYSRLGYKWNREDSGLMEKRIL